MTTTEPEWSDEDRGVLAGLAMLEADECSGCGRPLSETTTDEARDRRYVVRDSRCHVCTAVADHAATFRDNPHPHALRFHVEG